MRSHNRRLKTLRWSSFPYPAYIGSGTTVGRKPILSGGAIGLPVPRAALASIGIPPGMLPGPPTPTAGVAPRPLMPGNPGPTWLNAGAAVAQLGGTDNTPSEAARPIPAVTAALPMAGEPNMPVPEPTPLPSADPNLMSELAEPLIDMPEVDIDADEPVPDARLVPDVSAVNDDVRVVNDESGDADDVDDIDEAVEASPGVDIAVVSGDTV
jgi:hypothetical protein